jgi:hypothetical protein
MVVRGQSGDEKPAPACNVPAAKLVMPSPEELGLVGNDAIAATPHDWSLARQTLDSLGASYYRLEKAAQGGFRFTCALPYASDAGRQRNFECHAASEGEAIRMALQQVEAWQSSAPH